MELALLLYVASITENFRSGLGFFQGTFAIVGIIAAIVAIITVAHFESEKLETDDGKMLSHACRLSRRTFMACFYSWVALTVTLNLIPSRRDVYVMAGGYVAMKAANSPVVQATTNSALNSIETWLDKELAKPSVIAEMKKASKQGDK